MPTLRELLELGLISPDDPALNQQFPQPNYDIAPMQQNTMRVENGPDAGQVTPLDFQSAKAAFNTQYPKPQEKLGDAVEFMGRKGRYSLDGREIVYPDGTRMPVNRQANYERAKQDFELKGAQQKLDQGQVAMEESKKRTELLGAPNFQLTPQGDVFNPKTGQIQAQSVQPGQVQRRQQLAAYESGLKELQKDDAQIANIAQLEQAYKEWADLNARVTTGRIMGNMPAIGDPDRQRLQQLESYLAVNNFKPGQGQISNFERGLIKGAGPTTLNDKEANDDIVKIGLGGIQNMRDYSGFRQQYLQAKGSLLGASQAWQQYLDANPRYVKDANGRVVENPGRSDWQTYFGGGQQSAAPPSGGSAQVFGDKPDPRVFPGRRIQGPDGTFRSDGKQWVRVQ